MDKLKLAQFEALSNSSDNLGCEFLKRCDNDLNYSIPLDTPDEDYRHSSCAPGYSYLHIAAKSFDLASINELIKRKVDLVKQSHKNGRTPLHIVSEHFKSKRSISVNPYKKVMDYVGKLDKNTFVEVFLSAQVELGITANPESADGTSHLHVACIYNHVKAVQLFLSAGESVDHAVNEKHQWPGYTALHFAVRYSAFEAAEILLNHGADIHLKDFGGKSSLCLLIERLMDIADFLASGKRTYCPFYEQERDILESMLGLFLKDRKGEDIVDDSGLTLLHILCMLKDSTLIKTFFKQNFNINIATKSDSKLWPGWTLLHFAACFNVETFKFLLQNGADLTIKNANGQTPLDLCMERYAPNIIHLILSTKAEYRSILFSDGSTKLLDVILLMTNDDFYKIWLENLVNADIRLPLNSPIWPGCNLLHLAVLSERKELKSAKMIFEADTEATRIDESLVAYWNQIMRCLSSKPYNFKSNNADGLCPFHLAFHLRKIASVKMILSTRQVNDEDSNGLSCFHVACAIGDAKTVKRFAKKLVDWNKPTARDFEWYKNPTFTRELTSVPANSTPLHVAVIFESSEVVDYLLGKGARMHRKDRRGLEPLHSTLINRESERSRQIARSLVGRMLELREISTDDDLHCLHVAAICDDAEAVETLLRSNVDIEMPFEPSNPQLRSKFAADVGKTPLHLAVAHRSSAATKALIAGGADVFADELLLNRAIRGGFHLDEGFVSALRQREDEAGATMLHVACETLDAEWIESLLERGADPNSRLALKDHTLDGATPLHILVGKVDVDDGLLELLIFFGADVTIKNARGRTPLHALYYGACKSSTFADDVLFKMDLLLRAQKFYDVNPADFRGLSHFHLACFAGNSEAVKGFLNAGVDVDRTCDAFVEAERHVGYSPLHFALDEKHSYVARLLIEGGANVKTEDVRGNTPLHISLKRGLVDAQLIESMLSRGVDINAKNAKGMTPIEYLFSTEAFTLQQLNIIWNNGAAIDLANAKASGAGIIGLALKNAAPNDRQFIFDGLMNVCDIKSAIKKGANVIDSAVNVGQKDQLTVDFYLHVIERLVDAGCDINQEDRQGKTALHRATSLDNYEAVEALLLAGADLNAVDKNGESPITRKVINEYNRSKGGIHTLHHLACEVWKMRNIGLDVNESTKAAAFQMLDRFASIDQFITLNTLKTLCIIEYHTKVKHTFINELALSEFMSESKAVIRYSRMLLAERQIMDAFFKCGDDIRREFPRWGGFLIMQYRKAVARAKMIRPAMRVIFSAGIKLPALCLEEIAECLNYDELKLLVREY